MYTPQSLPRLGTQFTPGIGETTVMDDAKETIPFQDLSKLAKRMDWAVVKMTNVFPRLYSPSCYQVDGQIPWDSTADAVFDFFGKNAKIVSYDIYAQPIHMIMDRYLPHCKQPN